MTALGHNKTARAGKRGRNYIVRSQPANPLPWSIRKTRCLEFLVDANDDAVELYGSNAHANLEFIAEATILAHCARRVTAP